MNNYVYLDCEFADLLIPELLSLALVTADAREHYVEVDPHDAYGANAIEMASEAVRDAVLSQFNLVQGSVCSHRAMGLRTATWLLAESQRLGQPLRIAHDFATDFDLLQTLLRDTGHWEAVSAIVSPYNVKELTGHFDANMVAEEVTLKLEKQRGYGRHHALVDAHALRAACVATLTGKRVSL